MNERRKEWQERIENETNEGNQERNQSRKDGKA
jgi:hypothetical protein